MLAKHFNDLHDGHKRASGRQPKATTVAAPQWKQVSCQRLFLGGTKSGYFAVISPTKAVEEEEAWRRQATVAQLLEVDFIRAQIDEALAKSNQERKEVENVILDNTAPTEVSPWLEMTRWPKYLQGHSFAEVAQLASPANAVSEPLLGEFSASLDRVIEEAHSSIRNDKVNVFNQARINSFIQRRRAFDRPLLTKLRNSTYRDYKLVFKRLICFAYRTI